MNVLTLFTWRILPISIRYAKNDKELCDEYEHRKKETNFTIKKVIRWLISSIHCDYS